MTDVLKWDRCDVLVVGGGPSGLSAAATVARSGHRVVVIEREMAAGGVPRHCGHIGFGLREFGRLLTGPAYARRLAAMTERLDVRLGETATAVEPDGRVQIAGPRGLYGMKARRVILATGARERPRSARLVGGGRPFGITTTGALQQCVYLHGVVPFRRPVIVGTELVSFSTLLTLRHIGARPAAMLEPNARITARRPGGLVARWLFGTPLLLETEIETIIGVQRVEAVIVRRGDERQTIACDGVVFTGCFVPETALVRSSHLRLDRGTLGPAIDQHGRTSDPGIFACGNLLRPIETAGHAFREGQQIGAAVAASLEGRLADRQHTVAIRADAPIKYAYPQMIALDGLGGGAVRVGLRVTRPVNGMLEALAGERRIVQRRVRRLPERRLWLDLPVDSSLAGPITLRLAGSRTD